MATVDLTELLPELLSAAPTCPSPTAIRALRASARELCEKANCWQHEMDSVVVPKNVPAVTLDLPSTAVLHKPISLTLAGERLEPRSPTLLDQDDPAWRSRGGRPTWFFRSTEDSNEIVLVPKPEQTYTNGLRGRVAIKPKRDAVAIESILLERYQDTIVDGALYRILSVRSAPWYQPDLAGYHQEEFLRGVEAARTYGHDDDLPKRRVMAYGGIP